MMIGLEMILGVKQSTISFQGCCFGNLCRNSRSIDDFLCSWIEPLFWLGCRRSLESNDLYAYPPEAESSKLLNKFNRYTEKQM